MMIYNVLILIIRGRSKTVTENWLMNNIFWAYVNDRFPLSDAINDLIQYCQNRNWFGTKFRDKRAFASAMLRMHLLTFPNETERFAMKAERHSWPTLNKPGSLIGENRLLNVSNQFLWSNRTQKNWLKMFLFQVRAFESGNLNNI